MIPTVNLHFGLVECGFGQMAQFFSFQQITEFWASGESLSPSVVSENRSVVLPSLPDVLLFNEFVSANDLFVSPRLPDALSRHPDASARHLFVSSKHLFVSARHPDGVFLG